LFQQDATYMGYMEKSQLQMSFKLESFRSWAWYVTDKLMLSAEFNFSFQRFTTIIFVKICDLCKTFLIAYIYQLLYLQLIINYINWKHLDHLDSLMVNACASCAEFCSSNTRPPKSYTALQKRHCFNIYVSSCVALVLWRGDGHSKFVTRFDVVWRV